MAVITIAIAVVAQQDWNEFANNNNNNASKHAKTK